MSRGRTARPPLGNIANAVVIASGVTRPVPSASDGTSGRSSQPGLRRQRQHPPRSHLLLQQRRRAVVRFEQRRPQRQRVGRVVADVARRPLVGALRLDAIESGRASTPATSRARGPRRRRSGLKAEPGLTAAAAGAVERRPLVVAAADQRQDVAGVRIDGHERRLKSARAEPPEPVLDRGLGGILQRRDEGRVDAPVGRMVAAERVAEPLAEVALGVAVASRARRCDRGARGTAPGAPRAPRRR